MDGSNSRNGKRSVEADAASPGDAGGSSKVVIETLLSGTAGAPAASEVQHYEVVQKPSSDYKRIRTEKRADVSVVELQVQLTQHDQSSLTKESQTVEVLTSGEQKTFAEGTDEVFQDEDTEPGYDSEDPHHPTHLCDLPDDVLIKILSTVPSEEAIRTSILCKRWGNLWAFVPDINLENSDLSKRPIFLDFVGRACALRGGSAFRAFSMTCKVEGAVCQIKRLIKDIVRCGVQDLSLLLGNFGKAYVIPASIFDCPILESLNLQSCCYLRIKSSTSLLNLKVLILSKIKFEDNGCMEKLFSCSLLEKLELLSCNWAKVRAIYISAPKLQHLVMEMWGRGPSEHIVQMYGACLKYFRYRGRCTEEYTIVGNTSALVEAKLMLHPDTANLAAAIGNGIKLMSICSNVRELTLSHKVLKYVACRGQLPMFRNAVKLTVDRMHDITIRSLWPILRRFPRLRSLYFMHACSCYLEGSSDEWLYPMPPCFMTEIREVSFKVAEIPLHKEEIYMAGVFLKYAKALEEMTIRYAHLDETRNWTSSLKKLTAISGNCQLFFKSE